MAIAAPTASITPRSLRGLLAALCIGAGGGPALADIYHSVAVDGTDCFSDQPTTPGARLYLRTSSVTRADAAGAVSARPARRPPTLDATVASTAATHGLEPALLHAVIGVESGYRSDAVSAKGARGLMQLMPATAKRFGVADPFDPTQNLQGGARYLRALLDLFGQDIELALAAYNSGEGSVIRHGRRMPPYAETRAYVPKVMHRYRRLLETL